MMIVSFNDHIEAIINDYENRRPRYYESRKKAPQPYKENLDKIYTLSIKPSESSYTNSLFDLENLKIDDSFYEYFTEREAETGKVKASYYNFYHLAYDKEKRKTIIIHFKQISYHQNGHISSYWGKNYDYGFYNYLDNHFEITFIDIFDLKNNNLDIYLALVVNYKNELLDREIFSSEKSVEDIIVSLLTENVNLHKKLIKSQSIVKNIKKALLFNESS